MKYVVKKCNAYLIGKCTATGQNCQEVTNCTMKTAIHECLEYDDKNRIELIINSKNLTERGKLSKKILQIFEVEERKE